MSTDWDALGDQYQMVFRSAERTLEGQEASLDGLRGRVGLLLAAATIATSFLGGQVLETGPGWLTWLALGLFIAVVVLCLWIINPSGGWQFRPLGSRVRDYYIERDTPPASTAEMFRGLANDMEQAWRENAPRLRHRYWAFHAATVLLAIEIAAWIAEFALK